MGKDAGSPPKVPDYSTSYGNGVTNDISTLDTRRGVDTAAQTGGYFVDGKVGTKADYDASRAFNQNKLDAALAAGDDFTANEARAALNNTHDYSGTGVLDVAKAQDAQQLQNFLDLSKQYGPQYAEQMRTLQQQLDPHGFAASEALKQGQAGVGAKLGQDFSSGANSSLAQYNGINGPSYERVSDSNLPQYDKLSQSDLVSLQRVNNPTLADTGAASAGRSDLERQVFDELAKSNSGALDPVLQRAAEQASRARGAAVGNTLGDSSALSEAQSVQLAQQQRADQNRTNALGLLQSGQTTSDKGNALAQSNYDNSVTSANQNNTASQQEFNNKGSLTKLNNDVSTSTFNNIMSALNQRNQATQNEFSGQMSLAGAKAGAQQADNNAQLSYLGLNGAGGGGSGGGAGAAASPFLNSTPQSSGVSVDPNAGLNGAQWASQLYGAQSGQYAGAAQSAGATNGGTTAAVGSIAGAAILALALNCVIARSIYGEASNEWRIFRQWLLNDASPRRVASYRKNGASIVRWLANRPGYRDRLKAWMDSIIAQQRQSWA